MYRADKSHKLVLPFLRTSWCIKVHAQRNSQYIDKVDSLLLTVRCWLCHDASGRFGLLCSFAAVHCSIAPACSLQFLLQLRHHKVRVEAQHFCHNPSSAWLHTTVGEEHCLYTTKHFITHLPVQIAVPHNCHDRQPCLALDHRVSKVLPTPLQRVAGSRCVVTMSAPETGQMITDRHTYYDSSTITISMGVYVPKCVQLKLRPLT